MGSISKEDKAKFFGWMTGVLASFVWVVLFLSLNKPDGESVLSESPDNLVFYLCIALSFSLVSLLFFLSSKGKLSGGLKSQYWDYAAVVLFVCGMLSGFLVNVGVAVLLLVTSFCILGARTKWHRYFEAIPIVSFLHSLLFL